MKAKISILLAAVILVCSLALVACSTQDKIVGTWKSQQTTLGIVTESTITFNEDGTGSVSGLFGLTGDITYTINEDVLTITVDVLGVTSTSKSYIVSVKGDTMTLTEDSTAVIYTRAA